MNALQIIGLIVFIVALAGVLGYLFQSGKDKENNQPYIASQYTKEELDNIKLAEELYNKDLRPIVTKKTKTKPAPELKVVEPEFVAKVVETAKILPSETVINAEAIAEIKPESTPINEVKETKSEFPIEKSKKKRKYYPKKKK